MVFYVSTFILPFHTAGGFLYTIKEQFAYIKRNCSEINILFFVQLLSSILCYNGKKILRLHLGDQLWQ